NISIDRSSAKKGAESFESAVQSMKRDNIKVIMFPEGTRSRDGHIRPFKSGAFYYPVKSGIPIIPAAVRGAGKVLPKGSLMPRPGEIEVEFMPPIETAGMELSKRKELACLLQEKIKSALGQEEA
ncbi:MAG: lysophospholipid acyltransferase family protein, partial [Fibrobacterota bacterium]